MKSLLLGFALVCCTAHAQTEPDTLDYRGYFPLEVGNEWQYTYTEEGVFGGPGHLRRYRVLANPDSASGFPFLMRVDIIGGVAPQTFTAPVRYNDEWGSVWTRWEDWEGPFESHCQLDASFRDHPDGSSYCPGVPGWEEVIRDTVSLFLVPGGPPDLPAKRFKMNLVGGQDYYVHGLGYVLGEHWSHGGPTIYAETRLYYAQVGGSTFGTSIVSADALPSVPVGVRVQVGPNPVGHTVRIESTADEVRIVDALGREVTRGALRTVDVSSWPPGVYGVLGVRDGHVIGRTRFVVSR